MLTTEKRVKPFGNRELREPMVDADPIRLFLVRWMAETGDPIDIVAKGFDLDLILIGEIAEGTRKSVSKLDAVGLEARLGVHEVTPCSGLFG